MAVDLSLFEVDLDPSDGTEVRTPDCDCFIAANRALRDLGAYFGGWSTPDGTVPLLFVRSKTTGRCADLFALPRFCPFCGTPYRRATEEYLTPEERALLALVEAEAAAKIDVAAALRGLIDRGLVRVTESSEVGDGPGLTGML